MGIDWQGCAALPRHRCRCGSGRQQSGRCPSPSGRKRTVTHVSGTFRHLSLRPLLSRLIGPPGCGKCTRDGTFQGRSRLTDQSICQSIGRDHMPQHDRNLHAKRWRDRAVKTRALAEVMAGTVISRAMYDLANDYDRLADRAQGRTKSRTSCFRDDYARARIWSKISAKI
jgi:hypothetical protein